MAKRPYVSFAEVKQKVPIPDALNALGIAEGFKRTRDVLTGICPLPGHRHGPSPNPQQFKINRRDGVWLWHCFGDCQTGGDVVELVKQMTGYDNAHVRFWFAENFADRLNQEKPASREERTDEKTRDGSRCEGKPPRALNEASASLPASPPPLKPLRFFLNLDAEAPYLRDRGLTAETIDCYGLGLCRKGLLKGYIAIPIFHGRPDEQVLVAYLGRWPGEDHDEQAGRPRYRWPEGFLKSQVVYGLQPALAAPGAPPLIVVEGPFKVYHLAQSGFANTVAIFGSSLSDEQATILAGTGRNVVLLFDGDEAGQHGMRSAAGKLITRTFVRVVRLAAGQEPDQLNADELARLLS